MPDTGLEAKETTGKKKERKNVCLQEGKVSISKYTVYQRALRGMEKKSR